MTVATFPEGKRPTLLSRWIESNVLDRAVSNRFLYAVHHDSLISTDGILDHFKSGPCGLKKHPKRRKQWGV